MKQPVHSLCLFLAVLSGCSRLVRTVKKSFYQGEERHVPIKQGSAYVRSLYMYDQFTTVGIFHALPVQKQIVQLHNALTIEQVVVPHNLTFLLLAFVPKEVGNPFSYLCHNNGVWDVFLQIGKQQYQPVSFEKNSIDLAYRAFFGSRYSHFFKTYQLSFSVPQKQLQKLDKATLSFRSISRSGAMTWRLKKGELLSKKQGAAKV